MTRWRHHCHHYSIMMNVWLPRCHHFSVPPGGEVDPPAPSERRFCQLWRWTQINISFTKRRENKTTTTPNTILTDYKNNTNNNNRPGLRGSHWKDSLVLALDLASYACCSSFSYFSMYFVLKFTLNSCSSTNSTSSHPQQPPCPSWTRLLWEQGSPLLLWHLSSILDSTSFLTQTLHLFTKVPSFHNNWTVSSRSLDSHLTLLTINTTPLFTKYYVVICLISFYFAITNMCTGFSSS